MTKWKLVPVEPTPEMIDAWNNDDSDEFRHAYHVMLEAAPQPPKLSDERILELAAKAEAQWNAVADQYNQWRELNSDEITILIARAIEREILGGRE